MAVAGRRPKPVELRVLEGNPGHRPLPENTPKPRPTKPKKPAWLDALARREWNRACKLLGPLGLLTEIDGAALGVYCQAYSRLKAAEDVIAEHGLTFEDFRSDPKPRPEVLIAEKAMRTIRMMAAEFGMTPSSRSRIELKGRDSDEDEDLD